MSIEWLGLSHAKLSGHAGAGGSGRGGPFLPGEDPGQGSSGRSQGCRVWRICPGTEAGGGKRSLEDGERFWVGDNSQHRH